MQRVKVAIGGLIYENSSILRNPAEYTVLTNTYKKQDTLESVLVQLIKNDSLLIIDGEIVRAHDIRCDYVNKVIYYVYLKGVYVPIPKIHYERFMGSKLYKKYYGVHIPINQTVRKHVLWDNGVYKNKCLYELVVSTDGKVGVRVHDMSQMIDLTPAGECLYDNQQSDVTTLFKKYVRMAYGYYNEYTYDKHWSNNAAYVSRIEKLIYRYIKNRVGFGPMGNFQILDYQDVGRIQLADLKKVFTADELGVGLSYAQRRTEFELEVMCKCFYEIYWEGWTKSSPENLINGKHFFCKYTEKDISIIMRNTWLKESRNK